MKNLQLIARIVFSLPLIMFGASHLMKTSDMADMVLKDWPMAQGLVIISGTALVLGGIGIISGKMGKWASLGIALLMLIFIVSLHIPNLMSDDEMMQQMGMVSLLKDSAVMGGALMMAWYFDQREVKSE